MAGRVSTDKITSFVEGAKAACKDPGYHGVAYIWFLGDPSAEPYMGTADDALALMKVMLRELFEGNPKLLANALWEHLKASSPHLISNEGVWAGWKIVFDWLEKLPADQAALEHFEYACKCWSYFSALSKMGLLNNIGRYTTLLRRYVRDCDDLAADVDSFLVSLDITEWGQAQVEGLRYHCNNALLEYVAKGATLWLEIKDAFIGKIRGIAAWKKAIELKARVETIGNYIAGASPNLRREMMADREAIIGELKTCFYDTSEVGAWLAS